MMSDNSAVRNLTLDEAPREFYLSCRAKGLSPATLDHYKYSAGMFVAYLKAESVERLGELTPRRVDQFLDQVGQKRLADGQRQLPDTTVHAVAQGTKAFLKFWDSEGYLTSPIAVPMPHVDQKCPPFLAPDPLRRILGCCRSRRDQALPLLLAAGKGRQKRTPRSSSIKIILPTCTPSMDQWDFEILINVLERILRNQLARSASPASHNDPGQSST